MNVVAVVPLQALEHRAVLGIDGEQGDAARPRRRRHETASHDQRLLVGQGQGSPGQHGGHGGQEPGRPDQGRYHDVGVDLAGERGQARGAPEQLRPRRGQERGEAIDGVFLQEGNGPGRVLPAEIGDDLDVGAPGGQPGHRELLREARDELKGAHADGSGRSQDRDAFHGRPPSTPA